MRLELHPTRQAVRRRLAQIEDLTQEYTQLNQRVDSLRRNAIRKPVATFLEETASKAQVADNIDNIQKQRTEEGDFFMESVVEIRLKKVALAGGAPSRRR